MRKKGKKESGRPLFLSFVFHDLEEDTRFLNPPLVIMNKKYEIQCAIRGCTTKRGRKGSMPIHLCPKRGDAGQQWIEGCVNSNLSRLEYRQVVERKIFYY